MVSRDTRVHLAAIGAAVVLLAVTSLLSLDSGTHLAVGIVAYGVVVAGAHAYLAWRGEDGLVPVAARRRFVAAVALLLALGAAGALGPDGRLLGVPYDSVLAGVGVLVALAYLLYEARDGYLASRADGA